MIRFTLKISILLWSLLFCFNLLGQSKVVTEYAFQVKNKSLKELLVKSRFSENLEIAKKIPKFEFKKPFRTTVSGISIHSRLVNLTHPESINFGERISYVVRNLQIQIRNIKIHDQVYKKMGNVRGKIRIDGTCKNVTLKGDNTDYVLEAMISSQIADSEIQLKLSSLEIHNSGGAFRISKMNCKGPRGFEKSVKKHLLKYLNNSNNFKQTLQTALQNEINTIAKKATNEIMKTSFKQINENLAIENIPSRIEQTQDLSLVVFGELQFHLKNLGQKTLQDNFVPLPENTQQSLEDAGATGLLVDSKVLQRLVVQMFHSGHLRVYQKASDIPAFGKFMKSRLAQFFVWPDLMNFHKKSDFHFDFFGYSEPSVEIKKSYSPQLSTTVTSLVACQMYAPQDNAHVPYVQFYSSASIHPKLSIHESFFKLSFDKAKFKTRHKWDENYLSAHKTWKNIKTKSISKGLEKHIEKQDYIFPLANIQLHDDLKFKPVLFNSNLNDKVLFIEFEVDSKVTEQGNQPSVVFRETSN